MGKYGDAARKYREAEERKRESIEGFPQEEVMKWVGVLENFLDGAEGLEAKELVDARYGSSGMRICDAECSPHAMGAYLLTGTGLALEVCNKAGTGQGLTRRSVATLEVVTAMLKAGHKPQATLRHVKRLLDNLVKKAPKK